MSSLIERMAERERGGKRLDQLTVEQANALGYNPARLLPSGECAGILDMLFTVGLFVGLGDLWRTRFCYPTRADAEKALAEWDGRGDPPGPWIKEKPVDRSNPNRLPPANPK